MSTPENWKRLNLGCGETKLEGFVNVDFEDTTKPDVTCNFKKDKLPFEDGEFDLVHLLHVIEHIEIRYWNNVFFEIRRVMKDGGEFRMAFPEFEIVSRYFLENHRNLRNFWRATLYGRQEYPGDYHVVPMLTSEVANYLQLFGFVDIRIGKEPEEWNTFIVCKKGEIPMMREDVFRKEVFDNKAKV